MRWRRHALRLALELVIVFVGVYAAAAFAKYQQQRVDEVRRQQIREALIREITDVTNHTRRASVNIARGLAQYDTLLKLKRYPPLQPYLESARFQSHIWQSTLQSGGLELFEPATVYRLSEFYNELNNGFEQLQQMRRLSEQMLVPMLDAGPAEFYDLKTGRPRAKYGWYFNAMLELRAISDSITVRGDSLLAEFKRAGAVLPSDSVE